MSWEGEWGGGSGICLKRDFFCSCNCGIHFVPGGLACRNGSVSIALGRHQMLGVDLVGNYYILCELHCTRAVYGYSFCFRFFFPILPFPL